MIFSAFGMALGQLGDRRFLWVVIVGIALSVALLAGVYAGFLWLVETFAPNSITLPWIGPVGGVDTLLSWGSALLMLGLSVILMIPVASAFSGLLLEDVARAVEDRHYPGLPAVVPVPLWDSLVDSANFLGLMIGVNILALLVYLVSGPLIPFVFWGLNGFLLGREYFTLTATRRIGRPAAIALRRQHWPTIWAAGTLMAAPLSIPLINLVVPVLGVATFTHLFHRLVRQ